MLASERRVLTQLTEDKQQFKCSISIKQHQNLPHPDLQFLVNVPSLGQHSERLDAVCTKIHPALWKCNCISQVRQQAKARKLGLQDAVRYLAPVDHPGFLVDK